MTYTLSIEAASELAAPLFIQSEPQARQPHRRHDSSTSTSTSTSTSIQPDRMSFRQASRATQQSRGRTSAIIGSQSRPVLTSPERKLWIGVLLNFHHEIEMGGRASRAYKDYVGLGGGGLEEVVVQLGYQEDHLERLVEGGLAKWAERRRLRELEKAELGKLSEV